MEYVIKKFDALTAEELFEIYKLRVSVFVVEQNCAYQEVDDCDRAAVHVMLRDADGIAAYLRVLPSGSAFDDVSIGRVTAVRRREGLGTKIVSKGIEVAEKEFGAGTIVIEAQTYAKSLYEKLGFVQTSDEFLEDGIPHVRMERKRHIQI